MARGDHLKVKRMGGLYSHHGIDMGDGTVVHLSGEPFRAQGARVCRVSMDEFLLGAAPEIVSRGTAGVSGEEVAAAAEACLGSEGYDLLLNNCEHFVHFCNRGWRRSIQVERAIRGAAVVATGAAVVSATLLTALVRHRLRGRSLT